MTTIDIIYRCDPHDMSARPRPSDNDAALLRLDEGNREFAALLDGGNGRAARVQRIVPVDPGDLGLLPDSAGLPKQHPFAAVIGCADARVPVELIFGEGLNDLFVVRVAGNILGADVLGSLKYAVDNLSDSLRQIVFLGNSGCGALTAAVNVFLNPGAYLPLATKHSLRDILDSLLVVVQASARKLHDAYGPDVSRRPGFREALIEASIATNAAFAAYSIQQEFASGGRAGLQTAYGVYLIDTRRVWAPRAGDTTGSGLAASPRDEGGFVALGDAILRSERIASLLAPAR
jgi:carbonic anhydrase